MKKMLVLLLAVVMLLSLCASSYAEDAKYEIKDAIYDGLAVTGKVEHVEGTGELEKVYVRVTLFYANGTFAVMVPRVVDGEFYAGVLTDTIHVAVQVVNNRAQVAPPANDAIYGYGVAKIDKK